MDAARASVAAGLRPAGTLGPAGRPAMAAVGVAFMHGWTMAMVTVAVTLTVAAVNAIRTSRCPRDQPVTRNRFRAPAVNDEIDAC